jgi:hypothetical protein
MPQLDIDLLEDFTFFAFIGLLLGLGDSESEENAIETSTEAHLAEFYIGTRKALREESRLVATSPAAIFSQRSLFLSFFFREHSSVGRASDS